MKAFPYLLLSPWSSLVLLGALAAHIPYSLRTDLMWTRRAAEGVTIVEVVARAVAERGL